MQIFFSLAWIYALITAFFMHKFSFVVVASDQIFRALYYSADYVFAVIFMNCNFSLWWILMNKKKCYFMNELKLFFVGIKVENSLIFLDLKSNDGKIEI